MYDYDETAEDFEVYPQQTERSSGWGVFAGVSLGAALGAAVGAATMYMLDPQQGRRRRALVRDKAVHVVHKTREQYGKSARYMSGKARGLAHRAKSRMQTQDVSDDQLQARVRSALGRATKHAHSINVDVRDGHVTLTGLVLRDDVENVLKSARWVRGVKEVEHHMQVHEAAGSIPGLQS